MSSTRTAQPGKPLRQERYASDPEFNRGLKAHLVAKKAQLLKSPEDRALLWFIQARSLEDFGLEKLAAELVERYGAQMATSTMKRLGFGPGRVYNTEEVMEARREFDDHRSEKEIRQAASRILDGESVSHQWFLRADEERRRELDSVTDSMFSSFDESGSGHRRQLRRYDKTLTAYPVSFPAKTFQAECVRIAQAGLKEEHSLESFLPRLCLDPDTPMTGPFYFRELVECLREYVNVWAAAQIAGQVTTEVNHQVEDCIRYCAKKSKLVVIDGNARIGKSYAAQRFCRQYPGKARYVQVPSTSDDTGFFRAIATALGVTSNLQAKAIELRERIEEALQRSKMMVVFDEAHYLWVTGSHRDLLPRRINWIMTALVNHGVPVALVCTPQFITSQKRTEQTSFWTSEQFIGRIGRYRRLPAVLAPTDLEAVARYYLPQGHITTIKTLVAYAQTSKKQIAGIEAVVAEAEYLAGEGQPVKFEHIREAITRSAIPSDNALSAALADDLETPKKHARKRRAAALQQPFGTDSESIRPEAPALTLPAQRQALPEVILGTRPAGEDFGLTPSRQSPVLETVDAD